MGRKTIASGMSVLTSAIAVWAVAVPAIAAGAGGKHGHHHHRRQPPPLPDLTIAKGSLSAANGTITGSFFVKNAGKAKAKKSQAVVLVSAGSTPKTVQIYAVHGLKPAGTEEEAVSESVPSGLTAGTHVIRVCADYRHTVKERSGKNDCRKVGSITISAGPTGPTGPGSTVPTNPANLAPDALPTFFSDGLGQYANTPNTDDHNFTSGYYAVVPSSYDTSNQTPMTLVVWLHGCQGEARYDAYDVSTGVSTARKYIVIAPSGPEGVANAPNCWDVNNDVPKVMADIAQAETQFNIDRRRVIIAGYSSGGDLGYRTIFYNAKTFAGIIAVNTDPFRDTGSTEQQSLAAAAWKFNIVHVAHTMDEEYPVAQVQPHITDLKNAGYPVDYSVLPGTHYDANTTSDIQHTLLSHVDSDGWLAPAQ
jgi:predicted esterase